MEIISCDSFSLFQSLKLKLHLLSNHISRTVHYCQPSKTSEARNEDIKQGR